MFRSNPMGRVEVAVFSSLAGLAVIVIGVALEAAVRLQALA